MIVRLYQPKGRITCSFSSSRTPSSRTLCYLSSRSDYYNHRIGHMSVRFCDPQQQMMQPVANNDREELREAASVLSFSLTHYERFLLTGSQVSLMIIGFQMNMGREWLHTGSLCRPFEVFCIHRQSLCDLTSQCTGPSPCSHLPAQGFHRNFSTRSFFMQTVLRGQSMASTHGSLSLKHAPSSVATGLMDADGTCSLRKN